MLSLVVLVLLAACRPEPETAPSGLDVGRLEENQTREAQRTLVQEATRRPTQQIAAPTATPTRGLAVVTLPPTTPLPEVAQLPAFLSRTVPPLDWYTANFSTLEGQAQTLRGLGGELLIVQLMSLNCPNCLDQSSELGQLALRFTGDPNVPPITFVVLSADVDAPIEGLQAYHEVYAGLRDLGVNWVAGVASANLLNGLERSFGGEMINPTTGAVFVVDEGGTAYVRDPATFVDQTTLSDIIVYLSTRNPTPTPIPSATPTPDSD
ncbi:MAG: hypothetical protein HC915_14960 [Anaerolineae bacterium]|nr:hypothetical protein [Anaerolineae bacterium]